MKSRNKYIVFFDLETTGLEKDKDRIVQIGMRKVDYEGNSISTFDMKFNPCGVKSTPEALEKHGLTDEFLKTQPKFSDYADHILRYMDGCDLGGHNIIKFDIPFLMAEFERCGKSFTIEKRRIIDTRLLYLNFNTKVLLDMYREYCGEPACNPHDAMCDTFMCYGLYEALVEKHNITMDDIDEICGNNTRIDIEGFFVLNENMKVCMGKGKYKGKPVEEVDPSYFDWMCNNAGFTEETRDLAARCRKYILSKR